ncbi:MAG: hypothetical protein DIU71_15875 [Proteobacteria bacterium]|nr:MAG: hypothetical protein DIU71_15875 [Pseudomonadota bacterium]
MLMLVYSRLRFASSRRRAFNKASGVLPVARMHASRRRSLLTHRRAAYWVMLSGRRYSSSMSAR